MNWSSRRRRPLRPADPQPADGYGPTGPGTVILDDTGTIVALTAAAEHWLTQLGQRAPYLGSTSLLPNPVLSVAHRASRCADGAHSAGPARVRVATPDGR